MPKRYQYLEERRRSNLARPSSIRRYEAFAKEIRPSTVYESSNSRFTMPGSITFAISESSQTPPAIVCSLGGYWINKIQCTQGSTFPLNQYTDNECNYYCTYEIQFPYSSSYEKFDATGNRIYSTCETVEGQGLRICQIHTDSIGNLYVCYQDGVKKLDSEGNILWEKYFLDVDVYGVSVNSEGEVFINGENNQVNNTVVIAKLDSDGNMLIQKELTANGELYVYTGTKLDSQENVIWSTPLYDYNDDNNWSNLFLKLDSDLNVIWDTRLDPTNQISDYDVTEFALDSNDNLYANHYYNTVAKYDSNGDFVWARVLSSSLVNEVVELVGLGASENGDVFYLGSNQAYFFQDPPDNNKDVIYITKMNTDGDLQFISCISSSAGNLRDSYWTWTQGMTTVKSGVLNLSFRSNEGNYSSYFAKLPLTQVEEGIYGEELSFSNLTNNPNLELQPFTNTSRISTDYTISTSTAFDNLKSKTYVSQTADLITTKTTI